MTTERDWQSAAALAALEDKFGKDYGVVGEIELTCYRAGFRAGQEAMRERAAALCDSLDDGKLNPGAQAQTRQCAEAVRRVLKIE